MYDVGAFLLVDRAIMGRIICRKFGGFYRYSPRRVENDEEGWGNGKMTQILFVVGVTE